MRKRLADLLPRFSWGFFFATIVLIPFRLRSVLSARPTPPLWGDYSDLLLYASDVALLLTLATWLLSLYLNPTDVETGPRFLTYPLIGLTFYAFFTTVSSVDPLFSLYQSIRLVMLFGFYLFVLNHVKSLKQLIAPLSVMIAIQSTIAITQAMTQHSIGLQWLGEYELDPAWSGVSIVWTETARSLRAYGLSAHPNILGGILAFSVLLISTWQLNSEKSLGVIPFAILAIGSIAIFLTFSRSAWLGSFIGIGFIAFQSYLRPRRQVNAKDIALLMGLILMLLPFVWSNKELVGIRLGEEISFQEIQPELGSMGERRVLISAANEVFSKNAILGVGLGASPQAFMLAFPEFPVDYAPPHNVILSAAVETGLFGGLLYLVILIAPWLAMYMNRRTNFTPALVGTSAVLLAITAIGFFDCYPWCAWSGQQWQYLTWGFWGSAFMQSQVKRPI